MDDTALPDILVQRLHSLAVQHGITIKDMALKCGIPKSSLEGYMRLRDAKRPGIDALILISDAMSVSIDWLCGRAEEQHLGEEERKKFARGMFNLVREILQDIEKAQKEQAEPILKDGKVGNRRISDYALRAMLHFQGKENLFPGQDFDNFRILNELLDEAIE